VLLAAALLFVPTLVSATVVIPPRSLGELAATSQATVVAVAAGSRVEARGGALVTRTELVVQLAIAGPPVEGEVIDVAVPGGELGELGWSVPGAPRFVEGGTYLLFLARDGGGGWRPRLLAYGVLAKVTGARGDALLEPVPEARGIVAWERPDGEMAEAIGTYLEDRLVRLLGQVARGEAAWDAGRVLAPTAELPLRPDAMGLEYGCPMIGQDSGDGVRWDRFDSGKSLPVYSESRGEPDLGTDGGHRQVREAIETWMGVAGTSLKLSYGGKKSYSLGCSSGFDAPASSANVVVFGDPCKDLDAMNGCAGIAAYGGPWYSSSTHKANSRRWRTALGLYVVVNDGASCIGPDRYRRLLAHEIGHGLGFAHSSDPAAMMYAYCCNRINDTDEACARYVYPGNNPGAPPSPQGVTASDGTVADAVAVAWQAAAGAAGYEVWRAESASIAAARPVGEATGLVFSDTSAEVGLQYHYWVRARSSGGLGEFGSPDSGYASCASVDGPPLDAPSAVLSGQAYAVGWQAVSGATSYLVEESETAEFADPTRTTVAGTSVGFQHAVTGESSYFYRVLPQVPCGAVEAPAGYSPVAEVTVVPEGGGEQPRHVCYVAGIARVAGAGGESWRTDVELRNPGETDASAVVELLRLNAANEAPVSKAVTVGPGRTLAYRDVLASLFESSGAAVLRISSDAAGLIVSARTYNETARGSFGQFIPGLDETDLVTGARPGRLVQLAHATERTRGRRTNIGLVNDAPTPVRVEVRLFAASGALLGRHTVDLGPRGAVQLNDVFAGLTSVDLVGAYAVVAPLSEGARLLAYASVVDNRTGDPEFVTAR